MIKECQVSKNINSCMRCKEILNCKTRDQYIKAVYESMNKGSGGGFEF
jgi:nitrate reductase cytochrome c-type subunit